MAAAKSVLITGCSAGGIGDAIARSFHRRGHKVIATARDLSKVKHLEELGISTVRLDVLDESSIQEAMKVVSGAVDGKLDILVNNSGVGYAMPILDVDLNPARRVFDTNFFGRVAVTQALAPLLIASKGTIVNIGSISGINPTPWSGMYNACCAAVHMWSDTLRLELSPFDVRVVLVITGGIQSQFLNNLPVKHLPPDSLYLPEKEVIEATMFGAAAGGNHLPAEDYAELLVNNALKRSPKKHQWAGKLTTELWLVSAFLWSTAWDYLLPGPFGITALKKKLGLGGGKA